MADYHFDVRESDNYLATGGLGEVIGLTLLALQSKQPKVQMDSDMAMALCMLADEGLKARSNRMEVKEQ
jgi:hypothetical protein